jgi:hypothetical protein
MISIKNKLRRMKYLIAAFVILSLTGFNNFSEERLKNINDNNDHVNNFLSPENINYNVSLGTDTGILDQITWIIPEEGGTPRDINAIKKVGQNEFNIRATFEEGGVSPLRHAVSRVDLICRNNIDQKVKVTLHIDLSDNGLRTDYDTKPETGMAFRDFLFIKSPGEDWKQVNGSTKRWVATISFDMPPGETKVGLSPWYLYSDYLHFVNSLKQTPDLEKRLIGKSDHNREHWELIITDPSVDAKNKKTIFWHAREHAYETFSSFAMEGLIEYLLSDAASEFRRHFIFILHPMTNVDGVEEGFEYRGGYDLPDPHGSSTAHLLYETIDRLKPDFAVTWHNWVAPRDRNVVFYTDGINGNATPRAWLRFMQLFPSIRSAGHRWLDESMLLKYNWEGRSALSMDNPHQYAMKQYGTTVWGWEMPWWNFSVERVHKAGSDFAKAFLTTITEIQNNSVPIATDLPAFEIPRFEMHEFAVKPTTHLSNPFTDATVTGDFTSPSGKTRSIDGFYDGDNTWRLRFVPDEEGEWHYLLRGEGVEVLQQGHLRCVSSKNHGYIHKNPENPYSFAYSDSTPYFPMGETCYGLHDDSPITPELRAEYLKIRREQSFNFVRMSIGHSYERAQKDPLYWAWGGTTQNPDLDRLNPDFFHSLDKVIQQMRKCGMNAELILLNFYRMPFIDPSQWTPARERLWLNYILARYGAFDNIFMWTISNEYETHPDGKYRLDLPGDIDWVKATARLIKRNDPYSHLVTVHPVVSSSTSGISPKDPIDFPWRIGEFFGNVDALDVLSQQTGQAGEGITWDEKLQCWKGDDPNLVASVRADRRYGKPVLNTENGYEYLRGESTSKNQVHHTDKVRHSAWRIVCAGGYFASGFHGTIGHSDIWNRIDPNNHYTFILKDEGAPSQMAILYKFFNSLAFWRLQPFTEITGDAVALAEKSKTYVVYLPHGGDVTLDLTGSGIMESKWFNPRTGKFGKSDVIKGETGKKFIAPDNNDWVLLLVVQNITHIQDGKQ